MKSTSLTCLVPSLFVSLLGTACGVVVEPTDPTDPTQPVANPDEPAIDPSEPPGAVNPLLVEAPRGATTAASLFTRSVSDHAAIVSLVDGSAEPQLDILEQRIVSAIDQEIQLAIELEPPALSYQRAVVSDTVRVGTRTDLVLCENGNIATYDPRCETATPQAHEDRLVGDIVASRWRLAIYSEQTGAPVGGCVATNVRRIECRLPARAAASYRIVASANGFAELWTGAPGFGLQSIQGQAFSGGYAAQPDWQCWDWRVSGSALYCATRYEFVRFNAIDHVRVDFAPITVRLTANGVTTAMATPALAWDGGDDDLPGAAY